MGQPFPPSDSPPPPVAPTVAPAGWYHDGAGLRWWDGHAWGPAAPPSTGDSGDKMMSMAAHAGPLFGMFILPLVFYLISNEEERPETRWHAREALNFQLTFVAVYFGSFGVFFGALGVSGALGPSGTGGSAAAGVGFGLSFVLFFVVIFGAVILSFVFSIIAALKANKGIRWKYPVRIPFVKG